MSKPNHAGRSASGSRRLARSLARIAVPLLAVAFLLVFFPSCSGMWTSLNNPVDPVACEANALDYWQLFYSDTNVQTTYDPVLENLMYMSGYQVVYLGFNDGTYSFGNETAPFVMITTRDTSRTYGYDGEYYSSVPIFDWMTISDSLGNAIDPLDSWPQVYSYNATDGKTYQYYVTTFFASQEINRDLTYYVSIDPQYVYTNDGLPLFGQVYFSVATTSGGPTDPGDVSIGLLDGVSSSFSCDFSASDPYWAWSKSGGSGSIDTAAGRYNLYATTRPDPNGYEREVLFCKRYPHEIPEGTFAARATCAFPVQTMGDETGLYFSDAKGHTVAAIKIDSYGWLQCFGPGSSDGVLRMIRENSIDSFDYTSSVLGIRHEGGMLYFYVNGECVAYTERNGKVITNAGLFIVGRYSGYMANASYDDFTIAY